MHPLFALYPMGRGINGEGGFTSWQKNMRQSSGACKEVNGIMIHITLYTGLIKTELRNHQSVFVSLSSSKDNIFSYVSLLITCSILQASFLAILRGTLRI